MKTKIIIASFLGLASLGNSQNNTFPTPSGDVGIGTTSPNAKIDVRGNSTFGGGAVPSTYGWTPATFERTMLVTGNPTGGVSAYGTILLATNQAEAADQWLGGLVFGQPVTGKSAATAGLKAAIRGLSGSSGGATSGYGGNLIFCTNGDNSSTIVPERMRLNTRGNVGIGIFGTTDLEKTRLYSYLNIGDIENEPNGEYSGIKGHVYTTVSNAPQNADIFGVRGTAFGINTSGGGPQTHVTLATGVYGEAKNSFKNIGGDFLATGTGQSGQDHYGVRAVVNTNALTSTNCGIWADASGGGINYAGYFNGNIQCTGAYMGSDQKLKKNIKSLENSLEKIKLLNPSSYTFKTDEFKLLHLPEGNQLGLIAQELEKVFPELIQDVRESERKGTDGKVVKVAGYKSVNYIGLIPVLIGGVKEQQTQLEKLSSTVDLQQSQIKEQQKQIADQKEMINALINKTGTSTGMNDLNTVPAGFNLDQNIPNPFSNETVIKYTLPTTVANASMVVYDLSGKQVASFPLTEKGTSSITITSEKLAAGIYIYSIMADGKIADSKRMVVSQK